jgi:HAE1 family hydrophobic/amphiphilic exporter-1
VLENIERHREGGETRFDAARVGTREIAFAATAATFSVAAVFAPVVFVEGSVGSFLGSFGLTVAGSVLISLFVALTLTPMLAARMPPPEAARARQHLSPARAGVRDHRVELPARARLDARAPRQDDRARRSALRDRARLRHLLAGELFPSADEALFFAKIETAPGSSVENDARVPRARRGLVSGAARDRGHVLVGRRHRDPRTSRFRTRA